MLSLASESTFAGLGQTSRTTIYKLRCHRWSGRYYRRCIFIEGHRVILVNNEEHHFYISGVIRPEDIDGLGQIQSAESQMRKSLRVGVLSTATKRGWFASLLDHLAFWGVLRMNHRILVTAFGAITCLLLQCLRSG